MTKIFSTDDVCPRDRIGYWVDKLGDAIAGADCEPRRDQPFFGELATDAVGEIKVATYSSVPQCIWRSPCRIERQALDNVTIGVQIAGRVFGGRDGWSTEIKSHDLILFDMMRPFKLDFDTPFTRTTVSFPRSALVSRIGAFERFMARPIDGSSGIGAILSSILRGLPSHLRTIPAEARGRLAGNLLDLAATALVSEIAPARSSADMIMVNVKLWIETHLGDELSAQRIAARWKLSVRHLNRLFAREGTSLMSYVWERRLMRSYRDLTDYTQRHRSITEIAFSAGFNDLSHFSRSYRARFGCAPSDTRSRTRLEA
jgi:AraC family transcriptional regulator, positive regulator of tynA and feaB